MMRTIAMITKKLLRGLLVLTGAAALTVACFLVLPLMQSIGEKPDDVQMVREIDAVMEPPPPPPEEEPKEEPEPEPEPKPELNQQPEPLDLSQLELALNPGTGGGALGGDFDIDLKTEAADGGGVDGILSMSQLDQRPRPTYQTSPRMTAEMRDKLPGQVQVIFVVNKSGRVEKPRVQDSSHPVFEEPALDAIRKWRFEPGKRNGEPVRFRMRVPITFPKAQ